MSDQQRPGDDGPPARVSASAIGTGFVVVATMVLVLAWSGFSHSTQDVPPDGGAATDLAAQAAPSESPVAAETPRSGMNTRLARCRRAVATLRVPLEAARPAMHQWAVHVRAMKRLVRGEISLRRATASWNRTRVGARRHLDRFRTAETALRHDGVDCPRSDLLAPGSRSLPACAQRVDLEVRVLRSAQESLDTWEHHVHQMEKLRLGEISARRASRQWART
ncbi:MAG TPA: hypothetical protein VGD39_11595, partial [Nocardioides sp.]